MCILMCAKPDGTYFRHTFVGICITKLRDAPTWYYGWIVTVKVKIYATKVKLLVFLTKFIVLCWYESIP